MAPNLDNFKPHETRVALAGSGRGLDDTSRPEGAGEASQISQDQFESGGRISHTAAGLQAGAQTAPDRGGDSTRSQAFATRPGSETEHSTSGDVPTLSSVNGGPCGEHFAAADIARALGTYQKAVHRQAAREGWPCRQTRNRLEYQVPAAIADLIVATPTADAARAERRRVRFTDLVAGDGQREIALNREAAVQMLGNNLHLGKMMALQLVCKNMAQAHPLLNISVRSLQRWEQAYAANGIDGLVEQKRGASGRKPFVAKLATEELLQTAADAIEHGIKGRLNVARAYRSLVANPSLNPDARLVMHGNHASKSYVPPSVRESVKRAAPPLTTTLVQIGSRAASLAGPYSECSYENVRCGQAFTADDMTANVYVWCEWPNEDGYILIRPQVLATMDVGSMAWLEIRVVMRPKGQYCKDDVWGLIGDLLDHHGLFDTAIFEGGTWQSNVIVGTKTGVSDEDRFAGLRSIGVQVIHTRTPRGKIIEGAFNQLQHAMDNCRGFCGRIEMKDCPEQVKQRIALVRSHKAHPRQFFMHVSEFKEHIAGVMRALNNERNDGKILRGLSAWEKWAAEKPEMRPVPETAKWLYRSSYSVVAVTKNGVRVTQGTGKYQVAYSYSNPEKLDVFRGQRVVAFWNDYNPDTEAVVYSVRNGKPHQFICTASRVQEVSRLGASEAEWQREAVRKKLSQSLAVSQSATLAPYLHRRPRAASQVSAAEPQADPNSDIAERIARARAEAQEKERSQARIRRRVTSVELQPEDLDAITGGDSRPRTPQPDASTSPRMSEDELVDLLSLPSDPEARRGNDTVNQDPDALSGAPGSEEGAI